MKALHDPDRLLTQGLAEIRGQFKVPEQFPSPVTAAAQAAARRPIDRHADRTAMPFVTLDPASSTDLDQALAIEAAGADLLLHYAIADVGWFVGSGDPLDAEAWQRGETTYLPDGKAGLYPPQLAEAALCEALARESGALLALATRMPGDAADAADALQEAWLRAWTRR
ncbi:MAG TPA: RNB domain-containing ribonuclease, partial [Novosphingobium sp.]|nr:RNB domain-containing ribonuclease [Novosphingobium sp.]